MKILLATDGSKSAEAAVDFLIRFPFPKDSEVTVLTVLHRDLFGEHEDEEFSDEQRKALLEAEEAVREEGEQLAAEAA